MNRSYTTEISNFVIYDDYIEITLNANAEFELPKVKKHFEDIYSITKRTFTKNIIDFSFVNFTDIPLDTMEYMDNNNYTKDDTFLAIIINGLPQKIIGNFYLNVIKPKRTTKIFSSKKDAITWLNTINEEVTT